MPLLPVRWVCCTLTLTLTIEHSHTQEHTGSRSSGAKGMAAANGSTDAGAAAERRLQFAMLEELAAMSQKQGRGELDGAVASLRCVSCVCCKQAALGSVD